MRSIMEVMVFTVIVFGIAFIVTPDDSVHYYRTTAHIEKPMDGGKGRFVVITQQDLETLDSKSTSIYVSDPGKAWDMVAEINSQAGLE